MTSTHPEGPEISSGSTTISGTEAVSKSHKQDVRRRKTRQSPFKVPDAKSIFLLSINEKGDQKKETRKFLALPIDEKTSHSARMTAKLKKDLQGGPEEEEEKKLKDLEHVGTKATRPKQIPGRRELKMAMMKRENFTKESKHDLIYMERQKAVLELALMTKKSEILRMEKAIELEEKQLKQLKKLIERDNLKCEEFLRENEKKSVEARTFFEREMKSKQEKTAKIKKLNAEIGAVKSEITKFEEILVDYKRYKELLFKLSPTKWQEAQRAKALEAKVPSDSDTVEQHSSEPEDSACRNGLESKASNTVSELSSRETTLSPVHNNSLESSECEEEPQLYFTDPQQLLDLVTELTEQNLSLIHNSTRVEETVEDLRQSMETTRKMIKNDEEQLALQINDINQRIEKEKAKGNKLKQKVQLHVSLNTQDEDVMFDALSEKVAEVHRGCLGDRMTNLSTLEKLTNIENRMSTLLLGLDSIPKEILEMIKKIKDSEKRSREREEKLREQGEKQKERMRKYLERSLADSKKTSGRKLMPRYMPVAQKVKVSREDNIPVEDELHDYLFTSDDVE